MDKQSDVARWRADPLSFITEILRNPETGQPFELYAAQKRFMRKSLTIRKDGTLPYSELLYSCPKKSGKTATAAIVAIYVIIVLGGPFAEGYCLANDLEQSQSRVFQAIRRIIEASPLLRGAVEMTANKITFTSTGSTIQAIASEYAGAAGSNPTMIVFDELWGYISERSQRLWDEMVGGVPTRKVSVRLTVTYAGYSGESKLLENLYNQALKGKEISPRLFEQPGLLAFWSHQPVAPWQTQQWLDQMRKSLRPNAYLRMIENQFVTSESSFVDMADWDRCVDVTANPLLSGPRLPVWVGVDASVKRDSSAIVTCAFDTTISKVILIDHKIFQPSPTDPLDFESTIEAHLLALSKRFSVREIRYDPYQMISSAQRLVRQGLPMIEFAQSVPNLTEASTSLYESIKARGIVAYPDSNIRLAMSRAVAVEGPRGWKISKEKVSHKIDVIVALAMACLAARQGGQSTWTEKDSEDFKAAGIAMRRMWNMPRKGAYDPVRSDSPLYGSPEQSDAMEDTAGRGGGGVISSWSATTRRRSSRFDGF